MRAALLLLALSGVVTLLPDSAAAQRLVGGEFDIDVHNGPVLGSSRMIGLGGAYSAVATDISGVAWNPASYASRDIWETDWLAWDISVGFLIPSTYSGSDYDNNGDSSAGYDGFLYGDFGLGFQLGAVGFGALLRSFTYSLELDGEDASVGLLTGFYGGGYGFLGGQIVVGGGGRTAQFSVARAKQSLINLVGNAPEVGALLRLAGQPWRLGAAFRAGVTVRNPNTTSIMSGTTTLELPNAVHLPWELQLGFAYQFGDRPLNRRFVDPTRAEDSFAGHYRRRRAERANAQLLREARLNGGFVGLVPTDPRWLADEERRVAEEDAALEQEIEYSELRRKTELRGLSRRYALLAGEVVVTGPTNDGVGIEGFLRGVRDTSGARVTASVRLGFEVEPWTGRLKLRGGGYYEPSRFGAGQGRMHATAGFDLFVLDWNLFGLLSDTPWRISMVADIARRYLDWGISVGVWH